MKRFSVILTIALLMGLSANIKAQTTYCTPSYNGSGSTSKWFSHILNVKFAGIDRSTNAPYNWNFPATIYDNLTAISTNVVPNQTYPLSIFVGNGANTQYVTAWIDFNANMVFEASERVFITTDYANQGDHIVRGYVKIPSNAKTGATRMRVGVNIRLTQNQPYPDPCINNETANLANVGPISSQHFQDYTINILPPKIQHYVSSNTVQLLTNEEVTHSSKNNPILKIEVKTNDDGILSPLTLDTLFFNLLGTTNPDEIEYAKVFYTGVNPEFSDTLQVGKAIKNPSTYFNVGVNQDLQAGTNYFWLTYDISSSALLGNELDARCNSVLVNIKRIPQTIDPKGTRRIGYCVSIGTKTFIYVRRVTLRDIDYASYAYGYSNYTNRSTTLYKGYYHTLSVETGNGVNSNAIQAWIDFNQDGFFDPTLEKVLDDSLYITTVPPYQYGPVLDSFQIPINAPVGKTRMRVMAHYNPNQGGRKRSKPCDNPVEIGEVEDYTIIVADSGQAMSDFIYSIGCLEDSVLFTNLSKVFGTQYKIAANLWDFGDGDTSSEVNPKHKYKKAGVYNVKLTTVSNSPTAIISTITKAVKVNDPKANFSITNNLYQTPITFIDETTGGDLLAYPNGNYWEFGDPKSGYNNYSQLRNPQHTYDKVGNYKVKMIVTSEGGCKDTFTKTIHIDSVIPPITNFSASTFTPYFNQKVNLLDISAYDPTYWRWEINPPTFKFLDSTNKFSQNPSVSFNNTGTYAVRLYAKNNAGADSTTRVFNVKNYTAPVAAFKADPQKVKAGQSINFIDLSSNDPTLWTWTFGDGDSSFIQHPTKSYNKTGTYTIGLTASNPAGKSTEIKTNYIQVSDEYQMCDNEANKSTLFNGKIYDSGGRNNDYNNGSDCAFLIQPPCAGPITLSFASFDMETGDYIFVYDGTEALPEKLLTPIQGLSGSSIPKPVTALSGAMLIVEKTNDQDQRAGFIAEWSAIPNSIPNPSILSDSVGYLNAPSLFVNGTTFGAGNTYYWDYQNDGIYDDVFTSTDKFIDGRFSYKAKGYYRIKLMASNCKGSDSATKKIHIIDPVAAPVADFEVLGNDTLVGEGEKVYFRDLSSNGPSKWKWEMTPPDYFSTAYYDDNTTDSSQNPIVRFYGLGGYHIALTASNSIGSSKKLEKRKYILVIPYVKMGVWPYERNEEGGKIFDSGGDEDNYDNNEDYELLINPCAKDIFLTFNKFDLAPGDYLQVYDGASVNGKPLHSGLGFTGNNLPGTLTAESGKMFVKFISNSTSTATGFEAIWTINPLDKPVADFDAPDTAYLDNSITLFKNKSTGDEISKFYWDYDFDNIYDDSTQFDGKFMYYKRGYVFVRLTAVNCAGSHIKSKLVYVDNPSKKPLARFNSDVQKADVSDIVTFYDESLYGPNNWSWDFGTPKVQILNSFDTAFPQIYVRYDTTGIFDVSLIASNKYGSDTITKPNYIRIFSYCTPTVQNLLDDFGISYFRINGLENISDAGKSTYTDYSKDLSVNLELGGSYNFTIRSTRADYNFERKIWIDYNQDGIFEDSTLVIGELAAMGKNQNTLEWNGTLKIPSNASPGQTRLRIGVDYGGYKNTPCGPNFFGEYEDYRVFITEDKTAPKITLLGDPIAFVEVNTSYTDSGATAFDAVDGDISANIVATNNIDINTIGKYWVKYNVSDKSGNKADEMIRTVYVTPDVTPPVVTLKGANPLEIGVFQSFTANDPGATAMDTRDGDISSAIKISSNVDTSIVDTYTVVYFVYDQNSNYGRADRKVYVVDTSAPKINLIGNWHVVINVGDSYTDSGAVVSDNYYDSIPYTVSGKVDTAKDGWYVLYFNASDPSGNKAKQVKRLVRVGNPTSIKEEALLNSMVLYPNPSRGAFTLDFGTRLDKPVTVLLSNNLGQQIYTTRFAEGAQKYSLNLNLAKGLYLLRIRTGDAVKVIPVHIIR